jgi:hypothetical protein
MTEQDETRYEEIRVMNYKDDEIAGTKSMKKQHGTWFVHGIKDGTADLLGTREQKEDAKELAEDKATPNIEGTTAVVIKNEDGEIDKRKTHDTTIFKPEEME